MYIPWDPPLVLHLLTSWRPVAFLTCSKKRLSIMELYDFFLHRVFKSYAYESWIIIGPHYSWAVQCGLLSALLCLHFFWSWTIAVMAYGRLTGAYQVTIIEVYDFLFREVSSCLLLEVYIWSYLVFDDLYSLKYMIFYSEFSSFLLLEVFGDIWWYLVFDDLYLASPGGKISFRD